MLSTLGQKKNKNRSKAKVYVWEAFQAGNWNDKAIWRSDAHADGIFLPRAKDNVKICAAVTLNISTTVNKLYTYHTLNFDNTARTLTVNNDCQIGGALNMAGSGATTHNLVLNGVNNFINNSLFSTGTGSTVAYSGSLPQTILPLSYRNLTTSGVGLKVNNLVTSIANNLRVLSPFYSTVNITVFGSLDGGFNSNWGLNNSFEIELRGGYTFSGGANTGNATLRFTTNNQTYGVASGNGQNHNTVIADNIQVNDVSIGANSITNLTINGASGLFRKNLGSLSVTNLDGSDSNSTFENRAGVSYLGSNTPMSTGILDTFSYTNTFSYLKTGGTQNIKGGTYSTLNLIGGSNPTWILQGNVTCTNLFLAGNGTINYNGFTITVSGDLTYESNSTQTIGSSTEIIHTTDLYLRLGGVKTLSGNRTCTNLIMNNTIVAITFAGFTLTSTTTQYIANVSQSVFGTVNQPLTNLTLGGTATPNNKTLQGNVSVPSTYTVSGNAVKVDNGFTFGNP